ncbi:MAG: fatty acid desaturase [Planctomycetota bacterium]
MLSVLLGTFYGALMFFAHEVGHGAVVRGRRAQDAVLYLGCLIFCFSPSLWRVWHNQVHHGNTNVPGRDPDNFGVGEGQGEVRRRRFLSMAPGMGLAGFALTTVAFALAAQDVLWRKSRRMPGFEHLPRRRAALDSLGMLLFWSALALTLDGYGILFVIVVPMLVANSTVLLYVLTNHMLMPLGTPTNALRGSLSLRTLGALDVAHHYFSHHTEHHLFPASPGTSYPAVRAALLQHFPEEYRLISHARALELLRSRPRADDKVQLVEAVAGRAGG